MVSQILDVFICFLSLTDKHIYKIKKFKANQTNRNLIFQIIKCIKIKLITFFIFTFIVLSFYWYLISCFCAVYQNTQIPFIKDSIFSFLMSVLYPFVLYLFPVILRKVALLDSHKKRLNILYKLSYIIPFF